MTLIKTSLLNAISVLIKMLTMLVINKVLAIYVGPAGYAALGQFQNAVQLITTVASGAINTGVTKYTAEYFEDQALQHKVWRTAAAIALAGSIFSGLLVALFSERLARWFLNDTQYSDVFICLGLTLIFFVFNGLLLAILNGKKDISRYVIINITGSIFSLGVTSLMIVGLGLKGALLALAINQSLVFFVTLILCYRTAWFRFKYLIGGIDKQVAINFGKYTAMSITSAVTIPVSQILVRNHYAQTFGWEVAGYLEAMWRLSSTYLMFVTTTLGVYYLPRLSELKSYKDIKREVIQGYKIILPIATGCAILIFLLRDIIIHTLFTEEFSSMRNFFAWQMLGDTLRIGSWILAYVMLAKALIKMYVTTEIIFSFSFYALTWMLTANYGTQAASIAHTINYLAYWIMMYFLLNSKLNCYRNG